MYVSCRFSIYFLYGAFKGKFIYPIYYKSKFDIVFRYIKVSLDTVV